MQKRKRRGQGRKCGTQGNYENNGQGSGRGRQGGRGKGRGRGGCHKQNRRSFQDGAKTFRRGRIIEFLESMYTKRDTLKEQLKTQELQSINPTIVGELKAIEMIISEFSQAFDIYEIDEIEESGEESKLE